MAVLITGGMGVLGSMVAEELVGRGESVVVYARHPDRSLVPAEVLGALEYVRGDVLDLPNLVHTIRRHRVERVLHMAALLIGECQTNPYAGFQVNAGGTVNVYEAARMTDLARVVYTSSKSVYGAVPPPYGHPTYAPLPEDGPKNPVRVYDVTKLAGEHMGLTYAETSGVDVVVLRFASTFGPGKLARHGPVSWHQAAGRSQETVLGPKTKRPPLSSRRDLSFPLAARGSPAIWYDLMSHIGPPG